MPENLLERAKFVRCRDDVTGSFSAAQTVRAGKIAKPFDIESRLGQLRANENIGKTTAEGLFSALAGLPTARLQGFWTLVFQSNRPETRGFPA
jgi:hypothetical protein